MNTEISALGARLVQIMAERRANKLEVAHKIRKRTKDAVEKFLKARAKAQNKLLKKLEDFQSGAKSANYWKILGSRRQKRLNQQLGELFGLLLKDQQAQVQDTARLIGLILELTDEKPTHDDAV